MQSPGNRDPTVSGVMVVRETRRACTDKMARMQEVLMSADRRRMSRARILEGAHAILDRGVYSDLTVDALARGLRMSKSTLYKYFASKDDVVHCLVEAACEGTDADIDAFDPEAGTFLDAFRGALRLYADHAVRLPRASLLQRSRLPEVCQDRMAATATRLSAVVEAVVDRRADALADPALAATAVVAACQEVVEAVARGQVRGPRAKAVLRLEALLLPGLLAEHATSAVA